MPPLDEKGTGRLPDKPDDRDYAWRAAIRTEEAPSLPTGYSRTTIPAPTDQGATSMCVAHACGHLKMHQERRQHRHWYDPDEGELYARCKERDGYPGVEGTTIRAAMGVLAGRGVLMRRSAAKPAYPFKIESYVRLRSLREIKEALLGDGPVVMGIDVDANWNTPAADGQLGDPTGAPEGGHAFLVFGWADRRMSLKCLNSWGASWGHNGRFWLPYTHLDAYSAWDAWVAVDHSGWWESRRQQTVESGVDI